MLYPPNHTPEKFGPSQANHQSFLFRFGTLTWLLSFEAQTYANRLVDETTLIETLLADLGRLFNAHRPPSLSKPHLKRVKHSVLNYGLPDLSSYDPNSEADQEQIRQLLQTTIEVYEPRLMKVSVSTILSQQSSIIGVLHYRIDADLQLQNYSIPICFDSYLRPSEITAVALRRGG